MLVIIPEELVHQGYVSVATSVIPISEWEQFTPDHDGLDSCEYLLKLVTTKYDKYQYWEIPMDMGDSADVYGMVDWWELEGCAEYPFREDALDRL